MRVLFWGTPSFSVPALRALLGEGHDVVGVVTRPDRPAGRGRKLREPPVKQLALEEDIPLLQPERPRGAEFEKLVRMLGPEISVVVAYGQILRPEVLTLPPHGSINIHASLLPALRGAAPINWAIIRGHTETGVTIMRMVEALDAGPILYQVREPIGPDETASELTSRMAELGAEALVETLALLEADALDEREQDDGKATYAPRLSPDDAHVDFRADAAEVARLIRGMDENPGAWSRWRGQRLKIYRPVPVDGSGEPGTVLDVDPAGDGLLTVACGTGALGLRDVQPEGKRRMTAGAWVRGADVAPGDRLE